MSYQVLARKWRPRTFQDMVGQEPILRMLANALTHQRLHHAYLLTGARGVGKTTLGRILAKCLNCETGTCHACRAIDTGQFLDLYEVDAASRTKVEDTRELLDNVFYPPTVGRYKVYLIDEAHMLSTHSFNALLKTLEEPPEHVKFILATTDPKRLPITILSRCLQFHLKLILPTQITQHLQHICEQEKITADPAALARLAKAACGSMRDALSLLDQVIAYGEGLVTPEHVNAMLGCLAQEDFLPLLFALAELDGEKLFTLIASLNERGIDYQQALDEIIGLFHQIALAQVVPSHLSDTTIAQLAKKFTPEDVQLYYQIALLGRRDLLHAPSPQQAFEMTWLRLLAFKPCTTQQTTAPAINRAPYPAAPKESAPGSTAMHSAPEAEKLNLQLNATSPVIPPVPATVPQTNTLVDWRDLLPKLGLSGMAQALAANCSLITSTDTKITLALAPSHEAMLNQKLKERIHEALNHYFKRNLQFDIIISHGNLVTPMKQERQENDERLAQAKSALLQHPQVQKMVEMYDATIEVSLLANKEG
jgi:DNA polymerase III subunit gamma/tau